MLCLMVVACSTCLFSVGCCAIMGLELVEPGIAPPFIRALSARCSPTPSKTAPRMARSATASKPPIINKFTIFSFYMLLEHYANRHNIPTWLVDMNCYLCAHNRYNLYHMTGETGITIRVDMDINRLTNAHITDRVLIHICYHTHRAGICHLDD